MTTRLGAVRRSSYTIGYMIERRWQPGRGQQVACRALRCRTDMANLGGRPAISSVGVASGTSGRPAMVHGRGNPCRADRMAATADSAGHRCHCVCLGTAGGSASSAGTVMAGGAIGSCGYSSVGEGRRQPASCSMAARTLGITRCRNVAGFAWGKSVTSSTDNMATGTSDGIASSMIHLGRRPYRANRMAVSAGDVGHGRNDVRLGAADRAAGFGRRGPCRIVTAGCRAISA